MCVCVCVCVCKNVQFGHKLEFSQFQGARVVIADLQVSDGDGVAKEIGENATFVPTDVSLTMTW